MNKILFVILISNIFMFAYCGSIFDFLLNDDSLEAREENKEPQKNCACKGSSCICCLDFNISSLIDLGGPGCVRMKYLSPDEGIAINVSYGKNLIHNALVKGPDPEPTCLNIFSRVAQMCARFSELLPTDDGLKGCVNLEPMLLGETQIEFPVGCFRMGPNGMEAIESVAQEIKEQLTSNTNSAEEDVASASAETLLSSSTNTTTDDDDNTLAGYNTDDILAAVNESAEQGIALLSNWFGFNINTNDTDADDDDNKIKANETRK